MEFSLALPLLVTNRLLYAHTDFLLVPLSFLPSAAPSIKSDDDMLQLRSEVAITAESPRVAFNALEITYNSGNGSMTRLQDLAPALDALSTLVTENTKFAASLSATVSTNAESAAAAASDVAKNLTTIKESLSQSITDNAKDVEDWRAKYALASDDGLELRSGAELGRVAVVASEIDLRGEVQVLNGAGKLVNINSLPADVAELQVKMDGLLSSVATSTASMMEELKDLRSRCTLAEWEQVPLTPTTDRVCKPLTQVNFQKYWANALFVFWLAAHKKCPSLLHTFPLVH